MQEHASHHPIMGTWRLESFALEMPDGQKSYPYGEELVGYLLYGESGHMSAAFMNAERTSDGTEDLAEARDNNDVGAFMAYSGPFEVEGDRILHQVEVSALAAWIGTVQERWFKLDGDRLELLTTPLAVAGEAPVARLSWTRA